MAKISINPNLIFLSSMFLIGCEGMECGKTQDLGAITVRVPEDWKTERPSSSMRKAQYLLPGGAGDAHLVVYYFGQRQGGSVEDNLERWYGQFHQPDGTSSRDKARVSKREVSGMPVTIADISGTYAPSAMGRMMPAPDPEPNCRMLAAIVESSKGSYFFKLTGPEETVKSWKGSFERFVDGIKKN